MPQAELQQACSAMPGWVLRELATVEPLAALLLPSPD